MSPTIPDRRPAAQRVRLVSSISMLIVAIGGMWFYSVRKTGQLFDVGVNAHVQCAVAANINNQLPHSALAQTLAPQLTSLSGAELAGSGACAAAGRDYTDVVLRRDKALISVLLTQRAETEVFPRALAGRVLNGIHMGDRGGYAVAAWEAGSYLAFVVSNLPDSGNGELAQRLRPIVNAASVQQ